VRKIVRQSPLGDGIRIYSSLAIEPVGTIAVPVRDHLNAASVICMLGTDFSFLPPGRHVDRTLIQGNALVYQRNEAVARLRGDWLLFIDDDMTWQPDAVARLVRTRDEYDLDMVGALCFRRSHPYQPTLYMRESPTSGRYTYLEKWAPDALVEVDATGLAFCLIHKRVFERLAGAEMPSYEERQHKYASFFRWEGGLGEDLAFCQDAKTAGCRIFVDTSIRIGHMGELEITERTYRAAMAERSDEEIAEARRSNEAMGLPTLEREEALA